MVRTLASHAGNTGSNPVGITNNFVRTPGDVMSQFDQHIDILINAYKSSIEQMTHLKVIGSEKRQVLKEKNILQFAHIISYTDRKSVV